MIQQGQLKLALQSADGQALDFGAAQQDKLVEFPVVFAVPFTSTPFVQLGLVGITSTGDTRNNWKPDLAFELHAQNIQSTGFTLRAQLSSYNAASTVTVSWLALEAQP